MLNSGNNLTRGGAALSSDMPPLQQCLPLEPITLGSQRFTRSGELRRVLGVPLGNISEDHSFPAAHPKPPPPVAIEELKSFKESVQEASRKARDRLKKLRESICKLDKYREALTSKKRQRSDVSSSERSGGVNLMKIGSQIHRNPHDIMSQRLDERAKNVGLNKRVRTSAADVRVDGRAAAASRQQIVTEKDADVFPGVSGGSVRIEEKIRRLPAGGEGWETKMKRKRSVAAVGNRVVNGDRDVKCVMQPKLSADSKLRSYDAQSFRSKSSPGVNGINKLDGSFEPPSSDASMVLRNELESVPLPRDRTGLLEQRALAKGSNKSNYQDDNSANPSSAMLKGKISRAPRTGSIMVLDSSSKVQPSSGAFQGWEQPTNVNKMPALSVANNQKRVISAVSSSHAMAQWVGQRPHKNSRTRRANLVSPVSNNVEAQISSQGFPTSEFSARTSYGNSGSLVASADNSTAKFKRELENIQSPFGLSESEESGAGENKSKENVIDGGEVTANHKTGSLILPMRKNKISNSESGDSVRRQGRNGNVSFTRPGIHPVKEKLEDLQTIKPLQSTGPSSDKNKSKSGRPPSKKLKDRKASTRIGTVVNSVSSDFTGESDDDHEELFAAASSARKASNLACSGPFWKRMESIFASVSSEDMSYLKQQLSFADQLDEGLLEIYGIGCNSMSAVVQKEALDSSGGEQGSRSNQESAKTDALCERSDLRRLEKGTPLYQRVLTALIEEDETGEIFHVSEGKNISIHSLSDDSHCGSCNQIDIELKDRDRMESEVESNTDFQTQKICLLDRLSCDNSVASNLLRNPSMSTSVHSNEQWLGDDSFSHSDVAPVIEMCSNDLGHLQTRETSTPVLSSSECQYQLMCLDDRVLLELQSIGLYPEALPDLAEGEVINQDVMEMKEGLHQQTRRKKKNLGKIDRAIQKEKDAERRNIELIAIDQLVEVAYRKGMACRGSNASKVRKVSRQVSLAFVRRTLARCRRFEETGISCFSEPALQDVLFSAHPCSNEAKSVDCVGSGTASNTCNEACNRQAEARGSGAVTSTKRREVLIDDFVGSASSMVTSSLDSTIVGVRGKRSEREKDQNKDSSRSNSVSGAGRSALDGLKSERKTKAKPKQKNNHSSGQPAGPSGRGSNQSAGTGGGLTGNAGWVSPKQADEPIDFANLQLDTMEELGVTNELGGNQDLSNWLNFDEECLPDHDSIGLEIPMDDLSELNMLI